MSEDDIKRGGTGERGLYKWDAEKGEMVPFTPVKKVVNAPAVITDEIAPTMSMTGTDRIYTSKRKLRQEYRRMGFVETHGETPKAPPTAIPKPRYEEIRQDVMKSLEDLKNGRVPLSDRERQTAAEEDRKWKLAQQRRRTRWAS